MKIDVEGHELEVLRGASALLADRNERPRAVILELHAAYLADSGVDPDTFRLLLRGYTATRVGVGAGGRNEHWVALADT